MNIVLIEPDRVMGAATKAVLSKAGHQITWCRSAQSALDALDNQLPDIIVLELQLGIHNGIEFLYEIRSYPEWQQIPIVVNSINSNVLRPEFTIPLTQLGVQKILYKPHTSLKQLAQAVGHFMPVL